MAAHTPAQSFSTPAISIKFPLPVDKLNNNAALQVTDKVEIDNLNLADLSVYDLVGLLGSPIAHQSSIKSCAAETSGAKVRDVFTCFPNLPLELQRKIWSFAADIPRLLEFRDSSRKTYVECDERSPFHGRKIRDDLKSTSPHPALLAVCRESRKESMMKYLLVEEKPEERNIRVLRTIRRSLFLDGTFFLNLQADTLFVSSRKVANALCEQHDRSPQKTVWQYSKRLAINYRTEPGYSYVNWRFAMSIVFFLGIFPNFDTIIVALSKKATRTQKGDIQLVPLSRQDTRPLRRRLSEFIWMIQTCLREGQRYLQREPEMTAILPQARTFKIMGITKGGVRL